MVNGHKSSYYVFVVGAAPCDDKAVEAARFHVDAGKPNGSIMQLTPNSNFRDCVNLQIEMLRSGQPLEAFDRFFASDGAMLANDEVFARGAKEGRRLQEPYILSAKSIDGLIVDLCISDTHEICVFRNRTSFVTFDDVVHQIDGLCWQNWRDGKISEERYYDGDLMKRLISDGILLKPESLGG